MAKQTKKRFTFADAKEKIKDLEKQIVDLSDNVVNKEELETLRYQQEKYFELLKEKEEWSKKSKSCKIALFVAGVIIIAALLF